MSIYPKKIVVPLTEELWEKLRKIAFDNRISMNQIARDGLNAMIKKYEKKNDKSI